MHWSCLESTHFFNTLGNQHLPAPTHTLLLQGFMTGVLQMHARKYSLPIDSLTFGFRVTHHATAADPAFPPEDGILVDGLWVEGGKWSGTGALGHLDDSEPGVMFSALPVTHFVPMRNYDIPASDYQCPLYKTSARAGVLSTTGQSTNFILTVTLPVRPGTDQDYWVLQGTALLCMLDD
jgi:dynein heavy chain, axonemal